MGILFPRAFAFAVDDLGWNEGSDLSRNPEGGPHRAGVKRKFDLRDYQYMIDVGKAVGARIQCLFILSEMDRQNILANYPTTTFQRDKWNNSFRVNDDQKIIMNFVRDQSAYMEFGLHGTGHEYWAPSENQKRAEWYNLDDKEPWPEQSLREHIQCFKDIMAQYGFTSANGHSFPESFVPCAYSYYWNPTGTYSLGKLLTEAGVKYANTDFSKIPELNPPVEINGGGFDFGTHVINRVNYGNLWYELATLPTAPLQDQQTDIIESHWPNWLAQDDFLQPEITKQWVAYYKNVQQQTDRYVAKNTEQLHSQWLYKKHAIVAENVPGVVHIDATQIPEQAYTNEMLGNLVLKLKLEEAEHVEEAMLNGESIACYFEDEGYAFLYLPPLERAIHTLVYKVGNKKPDVHIFNDGTCNVYKTELRPDQVTIQLKVYGEQVIKIQCDKPQHVISQTQSLKIVDHTYHETTKYLNVTVHASDMQGSKGSIIIKL